MSPRGIPRLFRQAIFTGKFGSGRRGPGKLAITASQRGLSMGKIRVGINGMGRIGRCIVREWAARSCGLEIVACNNPGILEHYVHLLQYDSVHGVYPGSIALTQDILAINDKKLRFFAFPNPREIPWQELGVDLVIDSTGIFDCRATLGQHLGGSVQKVIMCAPGKDLDGTFVMGVNHREYQPESHHIVSNASCTTNCLAPVAKVLNDHFAIASGFMTTVHSYTLDQSVLDAAHKDLRRARAAAINMIPTTTGAARAVGVVIPALAGKLDGQAIRVPTADVSLVNLSVNLLQAVSPQDVHCALQEASESSLQGILGYNQSPLVSQDFRGRRESAIYDAPLTKITGHLANLTLWYDNEVGFSNRVIDLADHIAQGF